MENLDTNIFPKTISSTDSFLLHFSFNIFYFSTSINPPIPSLFFSILHPSIYNDEKRKMRRLFRSRSSFVTVKNVAHQRNFTLHFSELCQAETSHCCVLTNKTASRRVDKTRSYAP